VRRSGLAILSSALTLLGIVLMVGLLGRRVISGTWRATRGHPVRRTVAGVALAAVLAWLTWMWWPTPDTYRPIRPDERGTVQDVVSIADQARPRPVATTATGTGVRAGDRGSRVAVWPAGTVRPSGDQPQLVLLLTPAAPANAATAPTWVFPFDRPEMPGPGDNQAVAVNTTDGSTRYDVSFALVWATDGPVANRNEAYALASCTDCTTVAIAFQVVLVVGQANVVVPENAAVAVNYQCLRCVTVALARQLVLTLPGALTEAGQAELDRLWGRVTELAARASQLSLSELTAQLAAIEADIADIVRRESVPASPTSAAPTDPETSTAPVDPPAPTNSSSEPPAPPAPQPSQEPTTTTSEPSGQTTTTEPAVTTESAPGGSG
jgi:putative peptide zinc metalloprotease protein